MMAADNLLHGSAIFLLVVIVLIMIMIIPTGFKERLYISAKKDFISYDLLIQKLLHSLMKWQTNLSDSGRTSFKTLQTRTLKKRMQLLLINLKYVHRI